MSNKTMKLSLELPLGNTSVVDVDELQIVAEDGRSLYYISMNKNGELEISTGMSAKHLGTVRDVNLVVLPKASNHIVLDRPIK